MIRIGKSGLHYPLSDAHLLCRNTDSKRDAFQPPLFHSVATDNAISQPRISLFPTQRHMHLATDTRHTAPTSYLFYTQFYQHAKDIQVHIKTGKHARNNLRSLVATERGTSERKATVGPSKPSSWFMDQKVKHSKFYALPTQCMYLYCVDLRTNSDYFPTQHGLVLIPETECLLRGTSCLYRLPNALMRSS